MLSYASAMTLACLWMVWQLRVRPQPIRAERAILADGPTDTLGFRGNRAYTVAPAPKVPESNLTALAEPLGIDVLEFTPLEVSSTSVTLERAGLDGKPDVRDGGGGILVMKARLRNTSEDQVFAPLDEAFLRQPDQGLPDSFIEAGDERIYSYPLPVESEWLLDGQQFRELKPGESFETLLVSDRDALARTADSMTWRVRLRTGAGPENTNVVGVRFRRDQIH